MIHATVLWRIDCLWTWGKRIRMCNNQSCPSYTTDILGCLFLWGRMTSLHLSHPPIDIYRCCFYALSDPVGSQATARGIPERKCASDFIRLFFFLFGQSDGPSSNVFCFSFFSFLGCYFYFYFFLLDVRDDSVSLVKIDDAITIYNNNNQS
jgi:hypothetical protein